MINLTFDECRCCCHNTSKGAKIAHCAACCQWCPCCQKNIAIHYVDEHEKKCNPIHILSVELEFFNKNRKKWFEHHAGKFALIKGTTVHDFYDTFNDACEVGYQMCGLTSFLIKEVQLVDKIGYITTVF